MKKNNRVDFLIKDYLDGRWTFKGNGKELSESSDKGECIDGSAGEGYALVSKIGDRYLCEIENGKEFYYCEVKKSRIVGRKKF